MYNVGVAGLSRPPGLSSKIGQADLDHITRNKLHPSQAQEAKDRIIAVWCELHRMTTTDALVNRLRSNNGYGLQKRVTCDCWGRRGHFPASHGAVFKDDASRLVVVSHEIGAETHLAELQGIADRRGLALELCPDFPSWELPNEATIVVWRNQAF